VRIDLGTLKLGAHLRGPMVLSLEAGEFLRFEEQAGVRVRVESGRLWVTESARTEDVWLGDGDHARFDSDGLTLVEAVRPTTLRIERVAA
jgi:hypothetical protein